MPLYITTISGNMYEVKDAVTVGDVLEMIEAASTARGTAVINVSAVERGKKHHNLMGVVLVHRIEGVFNA